MILLTRYGLSHGLAALVLLSIAGFSGAANVYRWTDANGQTHFGEQPPAGVDSDWVPPPPPPAIAPEIGKELRSQFEQRQTDYSDARQANKEADAKAKAESAERAKKCAQSRRAIANINKFMNKRMLDKAGNYVEQSDRQAQLAKAQESTKFWCD